MVSRSVFARQAMQAASIFIGSDSFPTLSPIPVLPTGTCKGTRYSNLGVSSGQPPYNPPPTRWKTSGFDIVALRSTVHSKIEGNCLPY